MVIEMVLTILFLLVAFLVHHLICELLHGGFVRQSDTVNEHYLIFHEAIGTPDKRPVARLRSKRPDIVELMHSLYFAGLIFVFLRLATLVRASWHLSQQGSAESLGLSTHVQLAGAVVVSFIAAAFYFAVYTLVHLSSQAKYCVTRLRCLKEPLEQCSCEVSGVRAKRPEAFDKLYHRLFWMQRVGSLGCLVIFTVVVWMGSMLTFWRLA